MKNNIIILIFLVSVFTGCVKNEPLYTTAVYKNIQNDYILNAAKKVVLLADNRFKIDSQADSITATRAITKFKIYSADLEINTINITTQTDNDTVIAKLTIKHKKDYFDKNILITNQAEHNLIWNRINYILGLNKSWPSCFEHNMRLNYDGILCDRIYNQNNSVSKNDIIIPKVRIKKNIIEQNKVIKKITLENMDNLILPNSSDINIIDDSNITIDSNNSELINLEKLNTIEIDDKNITKKTNNIKL